MTSDSYRPICLYAGRLVWRGKLPAKTVGEIIGRLKYLAPTPWGQSANSVLELPASAGSDGTGRLVVRWSAIDAVELLDEAG